MAQLDPKLHQLALTLVHPAIGVWQVRRLRRVTVSALQVTSVAVLRLRQLRQFVLLVTTAHQAQVFQYRVASVTTAGWAQVLQHYV